MKSMLLLCCIVFSGILSQAQEQGIIDATWYLRSITIDGDVDYVPTNENFNLQFDGSLGNYTASANGVENGFSGALEFDEINETIEFTTVGITLLDCTLLNCDYEELYFFEFLTTQGFDLKTFEYNYFEFSNGTKRFRLTDLNGNKAQFYDYPMPNPDPQLFQTWYLYSTEVDLEDPYFYYGEDVPQMTIYPDLSFTAIDNCWEISGNFEYTDETYLDFGLNVLNYETDCVLGGSNETILEPLYMYPDVINCISGLYMETFAGFVHSFRDEITLSINEQQRQEITIFPNPAGDKISISGLQNSVQEVQILNVTGSILKTFDTASEGIYDISDISQGIYFLQITSEGTTTVKKFIKK